jgi:ferredoxin-type protein NapH
MLIPVLLAFFLGRVFCSWICPISFILELFDRARRSISRKPFLRNRLLVAKKMLWFVLIAELIVSLVLGAPLFVFLSPPGLVGREIMMAVFFGKLALEGVLVIAVILLELLTRRFFCRTFCPLGGSPGVSGAETAPAGPSPDRRMHGLRQMCQGMSDGFEAGRGRRPVGLLLELRGMC